MPNIQTTLKTQKQEKQPDKQILSMLESTPTAQAPLLTPFDWLLSRPGSPTYRTRLSSPVSPKDLNDSRLQGTVTAQTTQLQDAPFYTAAIKVP